MSIRFAQAAERQLTAAQRYPSSGHPLMDVAHSGMLACDFLKTVNQWFHKFEEKPLRKNWFVFIAESWDNSPEIPGNGEG